MDIKKNTPIAKPVTSNTHKKPSSIHGKSRSRYGEVRSINKNHPSITESIKEEQELQKLLKVRKSKSEHTALLGSIDGIDLQAASLECNKVKPEKISYLKIKLSEITSDTVRDILCEHQSKRRDFNFSQRMGLAAMIKNKELREKTENYLNDNNFQIK